MARRNTSRNRGRGGIRNRPRGLNQRLARQATGEAELRYGPEVRGLRSLLRSAEGERGTTIRQATGTAAGVARAARQAAPQTAAIYGGAGQAMSQINADVQGALGAGYAGSAAQREAAGAGRRLIESGAGAQSELVSRQVDAETAKQFAIRGARRQFKADQAKIQQQARDLEEEMGKYVATTYRDLADTERKYRQEQQRIRISERDSRRLMRSTLADITGYDPQTGRPTAETRQQRGEARRERQRIDIAEQAEARQQRQSRQGGGLTRGEISRHQSIVQDIQNAAADARRMRRNNAPWREVSGWLSRSKSKDNPVGGHEPVYASAGVELARTGRLSRPTVRRLRAQGFLPGRTPRGWKPQGKPNARRPQTGADLMPLF